MTGVQTCALPIWVLAGVVLLLVAGAATAAYFLSRPKQRVVPTVVGQPVKVAKHMLLNMDLRSAQVRKHSNQAPGIVIDADPSVGSKVDKGSTVTLTVSTGRSNVLVPNVQGESQSTATKALKQKGLTVTHVVPTPSTTVPQAQAIKTSPASGKSVPRGTDMTLFMSTGPPKKTVPGVIGDTVSAASSTLTAAGFNPSTHFEVTSTKPANTVISQDPGSQSTATVGSTVTIVIAQAPAKATVPFVTGEPAARAEQSIHAAGLIAHVNPRPVIEQSKVGTVLTQSPPGGSKRAKGSTISIVVATASSSSTSSSTSTTSTSSTTTSTTSAPTNKGAGAGSTTPRTSTQTTPGG